MFKYIYIYDPFCLPLIRILSSNVARKAPSGACREIIKLH